MRPIEFAKHTDGTANLWDNDLKIHIVQVLSVDGMGNYSGITATGEIVIGNARNTEEYNEQDKHSKNEKNESPKSPSKEEITELWIEVLNDEFVSIRASVLPLIEAGYNEFSMELLTDEGKKRYEKALNILKKEKEQKQQRSPLQKREAELSSLEAKRTEIEAEFDKKNEPKGQDIGE